MKRLLIWTAVLLLLFPAADFSAAETFYIAYTPRSANSSVFYIDVFCDREVTAAVFDLSFDSDMVAYYAVSAAEKTTTVRDREQSGRVTVAFADSSPVSGHLCRLSFKALQAGSVTFTLHMEQAADAERMKLPAFDDYTLTVKLGKDDVVSDGAIAHSDGKATATGSKSGERSSLERDDSDADSVPSGFFDLRQNDPHRWILIGAGGVILIAALIGAGILLGRRTAAKKPAEKAEDPPPSEKPDDGSDETE